MHARIEAAHLDPTLMPSSDVITRSEAHLVEPVLAAIQAAVADCSVNAAQVFAGHTYDRKGKVRTTAFGQKENLYANPEQDDFYLELRIRVPHYTSGPVLDAIKIVETLFDEQRLREVRDRLEVAKKRTAAAQDAESLIQTEINQLAPHLKQ